jgi:hypothetical protein
MKRAALIAWLITACASDAQREPDASSVERDRDAGDAALAPRAEELPPLGSDGRPTFCFHGGDDAIRDVFCGDAPPEVTSLQGLQDLLGIKRRVVDASGPADPSVPADQVSKEMYVSQLGGEFAVLGHSTSTLGRVVSPINPRVIMLGAKAHMAYQRGVQKIELVARSRGTTAFTFYLVTFEQACNHDGDGCSAGDLYTPSVESDWTAFRIQDDEELQNTPADCRLCHRRASETSTLLMRELKAPWTHFFFPSEFKGQGPGENGSALMQDYVAAKGEEPYGGLTVHTISPVGPYNLATSVEADQPLLFDAPRIENERWPYGPEGYAKEIQESPTWEAGYEAFKRGEQLALPYVDLRATDPDKQAELTRAYARYRAGEIEPDELPDLSDIYPDDAQLRARIGLVTERDATPADALIQACGACHNDVLDQSLSRARFNIALERLARSEIDSAIDRIERPRDAPGAMPPPEARQLHPSARKRLLEYLRTDLTESEIDPRLSQAAAYGMLGGGAYRRKRRLSQARAALRCGLRSG